MSKAASSPTARLLQSSRLFSLPRPLPPPNLEAPTSTGLYRASETATAPYPTHQAIATPASSHHRGDWGLKRPLPAKATDSTTPVIRVRAQDNPQHITDFGSAADHALTVRKWAAMGVPLLRRRRGGKSEQGPPVSVFEEGADSTIGRSQTLGPDGPRWKFDGPWLAGMHQGDFEQFVRTLTARRGGSGVKDVKGSSSVEEFRAFVKERIADERYSDARSQARERGEVLSMAQTMHLRARLRPDDEELDALFQQLRLRYSQEGLSSPLTRYICDFLDLPAVLTADQALSSVRDPLANRLMNGLAFESQDVEATPPSTHPSAGLSYVRTSAILENHPLHGPQAHRAPVLARVLRPRNGMQGSVYQAFLGVAGVVTTDSSSNTFSSRTNQERPGIGASAPEVSERNKYDPDKMTDTLDPDLVGGNKVWVQPTSAFIDEKGRVRLDVSRGIPEAVAVKLNDVEHIHQARWSTISGSTAIGARLTGATAAPPGTAQNANYGSALPDWRRTLERGVSPSSGYRAAGNEGRMTDYGATFGNRQTQPLPRRPEIKGFDDELGAGQGRRVADSDAMARIRELSREAGRR